MKIAQIGTYPPPVGGRGIHLKRLVDRLRHDGHAVTVFNTAPAKKKETGEAEQFAKPDFVHTTQNSWWITWRLIRERYDIIHFHTSSWRFNTVLMLACIIMGSKIALTLHSFRVNAASMSTIQRFFLKSALRLPHAVIPVNNNIRQAVEVIANRSVESVISPYLEPLDEPHQQQADLPESLKKFIQTQGIPLIVACASSTSKYRGCDLYGVDMCIKLGRFLHRQAKPFNMVLCLTVTTDEKYLDTMKKQIRTANLGSNVLLYEGSLNFQALLQEATLFVRPVASDGQPLSLIEAISSGVPSVASDVCERPSGCVVFASRDQNAFNKKCLAILNNPSLHFPDPKIADQLDGFTKIYTLYQSLLS